ncbi:MAG: hypothetical protein PVJ19_10910 [Desulfobacteraceae bacterium]|jgi:hypothetical protein
MQRIFSLFSLFILVIFSNSSPAQIQETSRDGAVVSEHRSVDDLYRRASELYKNGDSEQAVAL